MVKSYWTYIMASKTGTLNTGITSNLYARVQEHKNHALKGFTAKYDCTRLVWFEELAEVGQSRSPLLRDVFPSRVLGLNQGDLLRSCPSLYLLQQRPTFRREFPPAAPKN